MNHFSNRMVRARIWLVDLSEPYMPLVAGARVGPYEIQSILGSGGMGEVYRARDSRLNREVAVKVVRPAAAHEADRLVRFGREAQLLAALNHPNIAQLHGLEEAEGHPALVMELVEGPTLADRLAGGALPLDEALPIARQIVEALEAAHASGIVHRDLKPANIKVREDGTVKVLDFGLAKAFDQSAAAGSGPTASPTISMQATAAGIILGTAAYMSPEQARGRPVDKRADIWAFGAVLFEMVTGRRAFDADDISGTLALVLTQDPAWAALPPLTPPAIRRLLRRCLERDPKRRVPDIAVARLEIDEAIATPAGDPAVSGAVDAAALPAGWRWVPAFGAGAALAGVAAALAVWSLVRPTPTLSPVARFGITLPPEQPIALSFNDRDLALAPDGTLFVYIAGAQAQLMVRPLDRLEPLPLTGITNARAPFVSPDGRWVGFFDRLDEGLTTGSVVGGSLKKAPIAGGPAIVVSAIAGASRGASWGPDDSIVFATSDTTTGLLRVAAGGGEPEVLTRPDARNGERDHHFPGLLPGGRSVLFTIVRGRPYQNQTSIAVLDRETGRWKTLIQSGRQAEYVETGHLIYADGGALWAVGFNVRDLEVAGDPVPVLERIGRPNGVANLAVSRRGMLAYAAPFEREGLSLVWVDRRGNESPIAAPRRHYHQPRLSPDGGRIAVGLDEGPGLAFWLFDFSLQRLMRLPVGSTGSFSVWSPESRHLIFNALADGQSQLFRRAADGTGAEAQLTTGDHSKRPMAISADGKHLVFEQLTSAYSYDLMVLELDDPSIPWAAGTRQASRLLDSPFDERNASIAPDGRWMAYESNKSGQFQI